MHIFHTKTLFTRRAKILLLTTGLVAAAIAGCYTIPKNYDDRYRHIAYCASGEEVESQCKDIQHFSVLTSADIQGPTETYFTSKSLPNRSYELRLENHGNLRRSSLDRDNTVIVDFRFTSRPISQEIEIAKWTSDRLGKPVLRDYGQLVAVSAIESSSSGFGSEMLIPKNDEKSAYVDCTKPFRATAGNMVTDVGCHVSVQAYPNVILTYSINRGDIQDWQRLNEEVVAQFRNLIKDRNET